MTLKVLHYFQISSFLVKIIVCFYGFLFQDIEVLRIFISLFLFFSLMKPCNMWDLGSLTRDWTHASCTGSAAKKVQFWEFKKKKKFILRIFFLLWILCFLLDFFTLGICLLPYIYFIVSHITEISYQFTNLNFFPWFSRNSIKGSEYKKKRINLTLQFQVWFFCLFSCLSCMR